MILQSMSAILNFQKFEFLRLIGFAPPVSVNMPNFIKIGQLKLWRIYDVFFILCFIMAAVCHLGLTARVGPPTKSIRGSLSLRRLWFNLNSRFELSII